MSRAYIVTRNGGTVTKAPINDNKIPIYANKTAMEADASNIPDGAIVFTKSDHDDVIDQMKEYIRNQNVLSDFEDITISTDANNPTVMRYDGFIAVANMSNGDAYRFIYVNNIEVDVNYHVNTNARSADWLPVSKGDNVYMISHGGYIAWIRGRFYKLRDYSDRT